MIHEIEAVVWRIMTAVAIVYRTADVTLLLLLCAILATLIVGFACRRKVHR